MIPCICFCNSAEPPSLLIIVSNPPNDLEISLTGKDNTTISARVDDKGIEKYYIFYSRDFQQASEDVLIISKGATKVKVNILRPLDSYSNVQTLDLKTMTLTRGKLLSRSIILVATRVILTLGIEGAIFFLMGFREMRSWIAFFIINLITQGLLNVWINSFSPVASYLIISLIIGEFMVFLFETIAFVKCVKEEGAGKVVVYILLANTLSLMLGSYLIEHFPI